MSGKLPNENKVFITGRLTYDPGLRYSTTRKKSVCDFTIASERNYQVDGIWKKEVVFVNIAVWGELSEEVGHKLKKGDAVFVEGRLRQRTWNMEGKQTKIFEIVCYKIAFLENILEPAAVDETAEPEAEEIGGGQ